MRRITITILAIIGFGVISNAQDYNTGVGLRGGLSNGLSIKQFLGPKIALEGILSTRWSGANITGLYEKHDRLNIDRLNWYYGFGGHIGFWNGSNLDWIDDNNSYTAIGIDGILGIEYNFEDYPINISIDWKPAINIIGFSRIWGDGGAISLRYIF